MSTRSAASIARAGKKAAVAATSKTAGKEKPRCGLCGKTRKLTKTECCDQ